MVKFEDAATSIIATSSQEDCELLHKSSFSNHHSADVYIEEEVWKMEILFGIESRFGEKWGLLCMGIKMEF